jgi:hypothetical protein
MVMARIRSGDFLDKEVAAGILARVPDLEQGEISYCVEIMTIAALRLQDSPGRNLLNNYLPDILPSEHPTRENLSILGGFVSGLLAQECMEDEEWIQKLFVHIQQYLSIVLKLNKEERKQLAEALSEIFSKLTEA